MIRNDTELAATRAKVAELQRRLGELRSNATPEELEGVGGAYQAEIERMHAEVVDYVARQVEGRLLSPDADDPARFVEPEWLEWYSLTPQERWMESEKLWAHYLEIGGSLDPEPDTQSPFFDPEAPDTKPADGRAGVRLVRRVGV